MLAKWLNPIVQWYNSQPINKDSFSVWLQCLQACITFDRCCQRHNSLFLLLFDIIKNKRSDSLVLLTWTRLYFQFPNLLSSLTVILPSPPPLFICSFCMPFWPLLLLFFYVTKRSYSWSFNWHKDRQTQPAT